MDLRNGTGNKNNLLPEWNSETEKKISKNKENLKYVWTLVNNNINIGWLIIENIVYEYKILTREEPGNRYTEHLHTISATSPLNLKLF